MAAPITHIIFAEKFRELLPMLSPSEFIVGTSFPDIRYLGSVKRKETHKFSVENLEELKNMPAFIAGMAVHQYVDEARSIYWKKQNLYSMLPDSPYLTHALKFVEDIVLYDKNNHWQEIGQYFDEIFEAEASFGVPEEEVCTWHQLLKRYVSAKPDLNTAPQFMISLSMGKEMARSVHTLMEKLSRVEGIKENIDLFYNEMNRNIFRDRP